jgi:2-hydroxy-6-oxonona-2,4-dienedioate hydrolase
VENFPITDTIWTRLLGSQVRWVQAGSVRTRVIEAGEGFPLVLLHGISGHAETFYRNIMPLSRYAHVYAIDLLGHGFTDKPDIAYTLDDFLQHLEDFLDAIGAEQADFLGQSLGGWIASWLAIKRPGRVRRLILDTSAGIKVRMSEGKFERYMGNARSATAKAVQLPTRDNVRERLAWLLHDPHQVTEEMVEVRYQVTRLPAAQAAMAKILDTFTAPESSERIALTEEWLEKIHCPAFLVWGRQNPSTSWQEATRAAEIMPRARIHVIDNSGHWPQFEQPDEFNQVVGAFLQEPV